ncbi:MAG TPA: delta-60 repeat domain-containing protein, partial [Thermoleophilaceae bacterium]
MRRKSWTTLAAIATALALCAPASAADGDLDASFGGDGIVDVGRDSERTRTAIQPDGRIVAAGQTPGGDSGTYVARFLPSGELDTSFGAGGYVTLANPDNARALTVQPDGRIVFVGGINNDIPGDVVVVRLLGSGSPDPGFGGDGVVEFDFAGAVDSEPEAVGIDMAGHVVVAGRGTTDGDFEVARLDAAGSLDETFGGGDGRVRADLGGDRESPAAITFQGSRIVVGGSTNLQRTGDTSSMHFAAVALTGSGQRDTSFGGGDGVATAQFGSSSLARDLIRTQDAGLLLVGNDVVPAEGETLRSRWAILKLTGSGQPDTAFGPGGVQLPDLGPGSGAAWSAVTTGDGRLAVAGTQAGRIAIVKRTVGGTVVTPFGDGGERLYEPLSGAPQDIERQADGKLVLGFSRDNITMQLARVHDAGSSPDAPGQPPTPRPPLLELLGGSAAEGGPLVFTATLSRPSDVPVSFSY